MQNEIELCTTNFTKLTCHVHHKEKISVAFLTTIFISTVFAVIVGELDH